MKRMIVIALLSGFLTTSAFAQNDMSNTGSQQFQTISCSVGGEHPGCS